MSAVSTTKRLAKNSVLMYMRMAILMLITLYTSRVVLNQLGVEDYGIYNIVGSVVMMFSGLRSMFAASTQRFLNYEMGKGADYNLKTVFNTSIVVNIIVSILFILIAEIFGIWFLNNKINVDPSRLFAAKCVFQFSVITTVISIVNTTFDAEVIAHEKMNFFAYMSIIEGILKLAVVYLLSITSFDSLIFYGLLQMSVTIFVFAIHLIYCRSKFEECKVSFNINMEYLKKMTGFAGWNFLGTNTFMLVQSGMNMVLNVFGGPIVNAARGIAYQINNVVTQFITNVVIVINPYCTKLYASGDLDKAFSAVVLSSKLLFTIQICLTVPLCFATEEILSLWLGSVPDYAAIFTRLVLVYLLIRSIHPAIDLWFKASGMMRCYQIVECLLLSLPLIFTCLFLNRGAPYSIAFVCMILFDIINLFVILFVASKQTTFSYRVYLKEVILTCSVIVITVFLLFIYIIRLHISIWGLLLISAIIDLAILIGMYFFGLKYEERKIIYNLIRIK